MSHLSSSTSAYLVSAAHQPVDWHPWGDEPFARARAEDKPLLLDIGAVWCHWCHVMDGESYEDPELAAYLNTNFVCIKVDRDERPDVDTRYQRAVQALTGQGGWPLTAFLTPDGEVFYGGTYFPPDGRFGRPGFRTVLERVRDIFHGERAKVDETARELRRHVTASLVETKPGPLDAALIGQAAERMARLYDWRHGGFGTAPKFPHPAALEFLLARWWDTGEPWPREIAEKTLLAMARGGMYDQVGGGFHRYSVDERWVVPHFEKMAADNAELLRVYLHAWAAWGTPALRQAAEGIVTWCREVLGDPERPGFGASQDADTGPRDDGDYFTWTADEARALLDDDEWEAARRRWDIGDHGEMHHDERRNVLWVARSVEALGKELEVGSEKLDVVLERARVKLKAARDARTTPFVDRSCYAGWNAMLAEAFLEAGAILGRPDCTEYALAVLTRLWHDGFVPGQGMVHLVAPVAGRRSPVAEHRSPVPRSPGPPWLLEDQVHTAAAFLTACEHTGDGRWLDRGRELVDMMLAFYWDEGGGGFFDTREQEGGLLATRAKPIQDAPSSSPNGVAGLVLLRLAAMADEPKYRDLAARLLEAFAGGAAELGIHGATFLRAADLLMTGETKIVVADATTATALVDSALSRYRPRRVLVRQNRSPVPGVEPPVALVCAGNTCASPVRTPEDLASLLETFGRPR